MGCPNDQYPNNYTCGNGGCLNPQCGSTSDCTAQNPKFDCFKVGGVKDCLFKCMNDTECAVPLKCMGSDDDGKKYCKATGGCTADMCKNLGLGLCIDGACSCLNATDCTKPGFTACAK